MISRRNFLKLAGLSTLAVGAGYTTGKLTNGSKSVHYSIHGFIPEDEHFIYCLISAFRQKTKSSSEAVVVSDSKLGEVITRFDLQLQNPNYKNSGNVSYSLRKLNREMDADIIVSDSNNSIYALDDFNFTLANLRNELRERKAVYLFTADYSEEDLLSSLLRANKKEAAIENEHGLAERISLNKNYKSILVNGPQGKTEIEIKDGFVRVIKSPCRHEICNYTIASDVGNIIACAPNKVLIKIV